MENMLKNLSFLKNAFEGVYIVDVNRKFLYWNDSAEAISGYSSAEIVGRYCNSNILMHTNEQGTYLCIADCPLVVSIRKNLVVEASVYLKHKNGFRIPIVVRTVPISDHGVVIGAIEFFQVQADRMTNLYNLEKLRSLALTDSLSDLPNRYYIETLLHSKISEHAIFPVSFGIVFFDLDCFKALNDRYGHEAGDLVLKNVSKTFSHNISNADHIGRWGGDEFVGVCVCPDTEALKTVAEKMRILVENTSTQFGDITLQITLSAGATLYREGETDRQLIARADELLYQSKKNGRNRVTVG